MNTARPVESRLPEILEGISAPRTPDYFDDILGQVSRTPQRPGWSFPERWLRMTAFSERVATAPRIPMRMAVVLALLLLALAVSTVLIAGSQRPSVPAPFGVAGNGEVVFADKTGAIVAANVRDGTTKVIVSGPGHSRPVFSPDGMRVAFIQGPGDYPELVVSDFRGTDPVVVTTVGMADIQYLGWTPDGRRLVVIAGDGTLLAYDAMRNARATTMLEPFVDASGRLGNGVDIGDGYNIDLADLFRPPTGNEMLLAYDGPNGYGLYRRPLDGSAPIAVFTIETTNVPLGKLESMSWSPDGSRIVFGIVPPGKDVGGRAWIVDADGSDAHRLTRLDLPSQFTISESHMAWSPDGTRIAIQRWIANYGAGDAGPRPITIADVATGEDHEVGPNNFNGYVSWNWSPDGASILEVPSPPSDDEDTAIIVDAESGNVIRNGWHAGSAATWQRTVPKS